MKWSYSRLIQFERCPYSIKLKYIDRLKSNILPNDSLIRGNEVHTLLEQATRGEIELPKSFSYWRDKVANLRQCYNDAKAIVEEEWGLTIDWTQCAWDDQNLWLRLKLDVFLREDETSALIIDWKTGKWQGNEVKHCSQAQLYALGAFAIYPELEFIQTEIAYIDHNKIVKNIYTKFTYQRHKGEVICL